MTCSTGRLAPAAVDRSPASQPPAAEQLPAAPTAGALDWARERAAAVDAPEPESGTGGGGLARLQDSSMYMLRLITGRLGL